MTDRPGLDLGALLADPARAADVPADAIAAVLTEVTAQEARLGTVKAILAARLAGASNGHPPPPSEAAPLTQQEAAERYRIPLCTMRRLTRTGRVPATRVGRNRMVRPADLDSYIARCRHQGVGVGALLDVGRLPDVVSRL